MHELWWSILRVGAATYLGLCLYLFLLQSRYVYFPAKRVALGPDAVGLPYENVSLHAADGETIHGWFVPAAAARGTLLFCHGNAGNIGDRLGSLRLFHDLGLNVLLFDYRGYGQSTGKPTEAGTYLDASAAWTYLVNGQGIAPKRIVVFGESLGGAVAAWIAEQQQPGALILESTFTSVPDMAARVYPYLPARWLCRFRYNTLSRMRAVRCPVLIAHSPDDEMVPFEHGRRLFEAAPEPKVFVTMRGSHNTGREDMGTAYAENLRSFLDRYLSP